MQIQRDKLWQAYWSDRSVANRNALANEYYDLLKGTCVNMHKTLPAYIDPDDTIQDGSFGLLKAIEKYDPNRQVHFIPWASANIRWAVVDALRKDSRLSSHVRTNMKKMAETIDRLTRENDGIPPTDDEVRENLNLTQLAWDNLEQVNRRVEVMSDFDGEKSTFNHIHIETFANRIPDREHYKDGGYDFKQWLRHQSKHMSKRKRLTLELYYIENQTHIKIGRAIGLRESRVSQVHAALRIEMANTWSFVDLMDDLADLAS